MTNEVQPAIEVEEDLSDYLGEDPEAQPISREEYVDPEKQYESSNVVRTGLKDPKTKAVLTIGGVMAAFFMLASFLGGNSSESTAKAKQDPKDKLIADLQKKVDEGQTDREGAIAERQAKEYLNKNQPKKPASKLGQKAKVPSGVPPAYAASMARPVSYPPRPYSTPPAPRVAAVPRVQSNSDSGEISRLRKQLDEMAARMAKMQEQRQQVAAAPDVVENESSNSPINVVDTGAAQPVAQFDGGNEEIALLNGTPPITVPSGMEAEATLDLPIYQTGDRSKVLLTLRQDIRGQNGRVAIPKGARLLGYASFEGDFVNVSVETAAVGGAPIQLPGETQIAVLRENKEPLIAKSFNGSNFWAKAMPSILGGVTAGVNQIIAPQTETTFNGNFAIQNSRSNRSLGNAGLAAVGGVTGGFSNGLQSEIQSGVVQRRSSAKGVKAGTRLKLIFLSDTQLSVPSIASSAQPPA